MPSKQVVNCLSHPQRVLARYTLGSDGGVFAEYFDEDFRNLIDEEGIDDGVDAKLLGPEDGKRFFDALDQYFVNTTKIAVEAVAE